MKGTKFSHWIIGKIECNNHVASPSIVRYLIFGFFLCMPGILVPIMSVLKLEEDLKDMLKDPLFTLRPRQGEKEAGLVAEALVGSLFCQEPLYLSK